MKFQELVEYSIIFVLCRPAEYILSEMLPTIFLYLEREWINHTNFLSYSITLC